MAENKNNDEGTFTSSDSFDNPHEKALRDQQTVKDDNGVERLVSNGTPEFIPAPMESSDEEKKAAERRNKMFDEASKTRQDALKGKVKDEDRAVNNPADGGSQTTTLTNKEAEAKK